MLSRKKWVKRTSVLVITMCLLLGAVPVYADEVYQDPGDTDVIEIAMISEEDVASAAPETTEQAENESSELSAQESLSEETPEDTTEPENELQPEEEPAAEEEPAVETTAEEEPAVETTAEETAAEEFPTDDKQDATEEMQPAEDTTDVTAETESAAGPEAQEQPDTQEDTDLMTVPETFNEEEPIDTPEEILPESPEQTAEETKGEPEDKELITDVAEEPEDSETEYMLSEVSIESLDAGTLSGNTVTYTGTSDYTLAYQVLTLVNKERAKEGLGALTMDRDLLAAAMLRAGEIAVSFSHTRPDGTSCFSACPNNKMSGENIAAGQSSAEGVMNSWMNSAGHRANILTAGFQSIGIGCFIIDGTYYWAQCFGFGEADPVSSYSNTELTVDAVIGSNLLDKSVISLHFQETVFRDGCSYQVTPYFYINDEDDGTWVSIELDPAKLTWTSSNTSIATVTGKGVVSTLKPGTVTITATKGSFTGIYQMTVTCNHKYSYTSIVNGQTTATCSKCRQKVTVTVPTYYSLFWRNSTSDDGYYYSGLPLYNPVGSSLECWLNDMDGTEGFNYLVVDNSNPSVLSTPDRIEVSYFDTCSFKILKKGKVRLRLYADANPSLYMEVYMIFGDAYMWFSSDGADWYCYEYGNAVDGWKKIDSKWYCFDYGHMKTGFVKYGGKYYYIDASTGNFKTGVVKDSGKYYYFDPSTGALKTGLIKVSGYYYFSPSTGALQTGFVQIGSKYYYFSLKTGELLTGFVQHGNKYYYFNTSTGALQTGWIQDGGKYYYMDPSNGQMQFNWLQYQGYWFYLSPYTGAMVTGTQVINGRTYRFNGYGVCIG